MKKALLLLFFFLSAYGITLSQSNQDELQLMQSLYGMDKRKIVEEFIEIDEINSRAFWELYDEYEVKRKEIGLKRFRLTQEYVQEYGEVKPEDADNFMKKVIPLRIESDKLLDQYYKKVRSYTNPVVAMQFYQMERYLDGVIRNELLEDIFTTNK